MLSVDVVVVAGVVVDVAGVLAAGVLRVAGVTIGDGTFAAGVVPGVVPNENPDLAAGVVVFVVDGADVSLVLSLSVAVDEAAVPPKLNPPDDAFVSLEEASVVVVVAFEPPPKENEGAASLALVSPPAPKLNPVDALLLSVPAAALVAPNEIPPAVAESFLSPLSLLDAAAAGAPNENPAAGGFCFRIRADGLSYHNKAMNRAMNRAMKLQTLKRRIKT